MSEEISQPNSSSSIDWGSKVNLPHWDAVPGSWESSREGEERTRQCPGNFCKRSGVGRLNEHHPHKNRGQQVAQHPRLQKLSAIKRKIPISSPPRWAGIVLGS